MNSDFITDPADSPARPPAPGGPPSGAPEPGNPDPGDTVLLAGRPVARVGFGAMQLERAGITEDAAMAILRAATRAGVNHIDTAQFYGACNRLIRAALAPYPADLVLVTKVGADRDGSGRLVPAQRPAELRAQVEANLATLGLDQVGVVNLRRLDFPPGIIAAGEQVVSLDDQLAELSALRDAGKIGGIGLSNVDANQLRQARPAGIACVQNVYSVLNRSTEPVLDVCRAHGIAWVPYAPLGSTFGSQPKPAANPTVLAIAAELGVTPSQVALAWVLAHYASALLIPGTATPAHLAENLAAGDVRLPARSLAALDALAGLPAALSPCKQHNGRFHQTRQRLTRRIIRSPRKNSLLAVFPS